MSPLHRLESDRCAESPQPVAPRRLGGGAGALLDRPVL